MLGRWARGFARNIAQAQIVRVKTVVRHQDHRRILACQLQQRAQHRIVVAVARLDAVVENPIIPVIHLRPLRRMVLHEPVPKVVDRVVIHAHQVPRLVLDQCRRRRMDRRAIRDRLHQRLHPRILLRLVQLLTRHPVQPRQESPQIVLVQLGWVEPQLRQMLLQPFRMNRPRLERPRLGWTMGRLIIVGNHHPLAQRLGRIGWPPADGDRVLVVLIENIPDRLGLTRKIRHGTDATTDGIGLGKPVDPVFVGPLARRDRSPQHRRQTRLQRRDVAHHPLLQETRQMRHLPRIQQRVNHLPISGIPADQENFAGRRRRRTSSHRKR